MAADQGGLQHRWHQTRRRCAVAACPVRCASSLRDHSCRVASIHLDRGRQMAPAGPRGGAARWSCRRHWRPVHPRTGRRRTPGQDPSTTRVRTNLHDPAPGSAAVLMVLVVLIRARLSSSRNSGTPSKAVITPTGSWRGAMTVRASVSRQHQEGAAEQGGRRHQDAMVGAHHAGASGAARSGRQNRCCRRWTPRWR